MTATSPLPILDWQCLLNELDTRGIATTGLLLDQNTCQALTSSYDNKQPFRSQVIMQRHGFGEGEYQYFNYPLPDTVQTIREQVYPHLAPLANRWMAATGSAVRYPTKHAEFLQRCHQAGQYKPTPLLLRYQTGDYNCLHQDLYGEHVFPIQLAILLSEPEQDFEGGEFVITEQRPRRQSRAEVVPLRRGEGVLFAVNERPQRGTRGTYKVKMRHGVSRLHAGQRYTLGVIFHDAA